MPEWAILGGNDICVIPPDLRLLRDQYTVQITGEGLWKWRKLETKSSIFDALVGSLHAVGYSLSPSNFPVLLQGSFLVQKRGCVLAFMANEFGTTSYKQRHMRWKLQRRCGATQRCNRKSCP